ncbi:TRAP transporter substrate-binding protein DctP [Marinobacter sp. 1-3A]|uniref:TRAP transporter substrate-binding protein n=1 Tax=Marinobacter sp. 1-3A TaxID=2582920 RepID=UPI001908CAC1|nr:TRAP transporter substrate-binding protein DctP [Marinobacter sp. 1-3A]MBK1875057.1 TRAP transporter substrate-binding protein DctP [Marinobacter sp. 1-3A]
MKSLSRLALPKVFSVLTLSLALASGLTAADADARTLNFSTPAPPTDRPTNDALLWWADEVEKRTEGSISIKIHWLQSLVKYKDAARGVKSGVADIAPMTPEYTMAQNPLLALSSTETGPGDNYVATEAWRRASENFEPLLEEYRRMGARPIGFYSSGARVNMSSTRPYLTPDDFKGDKVRLTPRSVNAANINNWDVTPVNITFADFYSAMERGTIDGAQSYLYLMAPYKHNEVSDYVVETDLGQSLVVVLMNERVWGSLSDEEQKVFEDLLPEYIERMTKAGLEEAAMAKDLLINHPTYAVEYFELDDKQKQAWEKDLAPATEQYVADRAKQNPAATELHERFFDALQEVKKEVAEQGYPWDRK